MIVIALCSCFLLRNLFVCGSRSQPCCQVVKERKHPTSKDPPEKVTETIFGAVPRFSQIEKGKKDIRENAAKMSLFSVILSIRENNVVKPEMAAINRKERGDNFLCLALSG